MNTGKKIRKHIALYLALVMMFSTFVFPVAVAGGAVSPPDMHHCCFNASALHAPYVAQLAPFDSVVPLFSEPTISAGTASGRAGDIVTVPIWLNGNPGIIGMQFSVNFDTTALGFVSHSGATGLLAGHISLPMPSGTAPPLLFAWNDGLAMTNNYAEGVVLNLSFEILPGASASSYPIILNFVIANNFDLQPVTFDTWSGNVNVINPPAPSDFYWGDIEAINNIITTHGLPLQTTAAGATSFPTGWLNSGVSLPPGGGVTTPPALIAPFSWTTGLIDGVSGASPNLRVSRLWLMGAPITGTFTLTGLYELVSLEICEIPTLTGINISDRPTLSGVCLVNTPGLQSIDITNTGVQWFSTAFRPNLTELILSGNQLTGLSVTNNTSLMLLDVRDNPNLTQILGLDSLPPGAVILGWGGAGFTVTFNPAGGTVSPASGITVMGGTLDALPLPTQAGYDFLGWFTAATGGTQVTISNVFTADTEIFAQWTPAGCLHPDTSTATTPATCASAGETVETCDDCNAILSVTPIPALGHTWGDWIVATPPTATTAGTERRICTTCDIYEIRTISLPPVGGGGGGGPSEPVNAPPTTNVPPAQEETTDPGAGATNGETDTDDAVAAVQDALDESDSGQDSLVALIAENAILNAASVEVDAPLIIVNQPNVEELQEIAFTTRHDIYRMLEYNEYEIERALNANVAFVTTEFEEVDIRIESSTLLTDVDEIWIRTPYYDLSFTMGFVRNNVSGVPLYITVSSSASDDIPAEEGLVLLSGTPAPRTYSVTFSRPINEPVRLSVKPLPGSDPIYQTVVNARGENVGGKHNPVTGLLNARVNQSGEYKVIENRVDFTDILNRSAEMQRAVRTLATQGIITGTAPGQFSPDAHITRAELAALLTRSLGRLDPNADGRFADVSSGAWYFGSVGSASRAGIMTGVGNNRFNPGQAIPRDQLIVVTSRILRTEMGYRHPADPTRYLQTYTDHAEFADWSLDELALAMRLGIPVRQADGRFRPDEALTRGEASIILYRMFLRIW
ncbi:MAG: S-layer homology domain-containing protein [Defluviitaleaceae bacterium]|nr:S-layer homology domain-containing protein [Defluviitaleaceae bacterium]